MALRPLAGLLWAVAPVASVCSPPADAAQRVIPRSHTGRTALSLAPGHPIRRLLPRAVTVRPAPPGLAIGGPVKLLPCVTTGGAPAEAPPRENLIWEGAERISKPEDWVDLRFGVDVPGSALLLGVEGDAELSFAEVVFAGGQTRVVDFRDRLYPPGVYRLLNDRPGRLVKLVRLIARSRSPSATCRLLVLRQLLSPGRYR